MVNTDTVFTYVTTTSLNTTALAATSATLNGHTSKPIVVEALAVDTSGGGAASTTAITTVPANSILVDVTAIVTATFDGDATTTFEVGVASNSDKYVDPSDLNAAAVDSQQSMIGGTNNDQTNPEYIAAATPIIATWTNTASASTGGATVRVVYIPLSAAA